MIRRSSVHSNSSSRQNSRPATKSRSQSQFKPSSKSQIEEHLSGMEEEEAEISLTEEQKEKARNFLANLRPGIKQKHNMEEIANEEEKEKLQKQRDNDGIFVVKGKEVYYDKKSLCIFKHTWCLRKFFVWVVEWNWFDRVIIAAILSNSMFLAVYDYGDRDNLTTRNKIIEQAGLVFTVIFTTECVFKIVGMGFIVHRNAYLRDGWNWVDFIVVVTGLIEVIPGLPSFRGLRTLRVLRPLRSINAIPKMKRLIASLIQSLPALGNVVVFLLFIFILFSILGVQQFVGQLYYRCRLTPAPVNGVWAKNESIQRLCSSGLGDFDCPANNYCGSPLQYGISLEADGVPEEALINYGIVTFDNVGVGMLTLFQVITLEGWTALMYNLMDSNMAAMSVIYFTLVVLFGSFFLLNLILAVIMQAFDNIDKDEQEAKDQEKAQTLAAQMADSKERQLESLKGKTEGEESKHEQEHEDREAIYVQEYMDQQQKEAKEPNPNSASYEEEVMKEGLKSKPGTAELENRILEEHGSPTKKVAREEGEDEDHSFCVPETSRQKVDDESGQVRVEDLADNTLGRNDLKNLKEFSENQDKAEESDKMKDVPSRARKCKFYYVFYVICEHSIFNTVIIMMILANTIVLALDRHPIDPTNAANNELANTILSWCFFAEMIIKLIGLGFKGYAADRFNLFDCFIVMVSLVENVMEWAQAGSNVGTGGAISAFRGFRLFRVFKLARSWKKFRDLIFKIIKTLGDVSTFSVLLVLFMFTYTLLGMELFAFKVAYDVNGNIDLTGGEAPRANFNSFLQGFTTVFIVLIAEDWNGVMYNYARVLGGGSIIYFVSLVIFGNFIMLNLFLAILLKNFEEDDKLDLIEAKENKQSIFQKFKTALSEKLKRTFSKKKSTEKADGSNDSKMKRSLSIVNDDENSKNEDKDSLRRSMQGSMTGFKLMKKDSVISNSSKRMVSRDQNRQSSPSGSMNNTARKGFRISGQNFNQTKKPSYNYDELTGKSLCLLGPLNCFRRICYRICKFKYFEPFILFMIIFSTILLTLESPLDDPNSEKLWVLYQIDIVVTTIFTLESFLKIVKSGLIINGSDSYLRSSWNIMDLLIVAFSIVSLAASNINIKFIKVLRMLRVLRPLRMISRNEGLKIAVQSLLASIPEIVNVIIISILFLMLFGILGTNYFKGAFFYCHNENIDTIYWPSILTKQDCNNHGGDWFNKDSNFDNSIASMVTLFIMCTTEGWIEIMWSGVDAVGIDMEPQREYGPLWVFFFILFIVFGALFIMNLFVGVVINNFNFEKEKLGKNHLLTKTQAEWVQVQLLCISTKPNKKQQMSNNRFRNFMIRISEATWFDAFILICIVLNTVILSLKWYDEPSDLPSTNEKINYAFAAIFTLEAIIKLIAYGKFYFNSGWNVFDFVIVIGTIAGIMVGLLSSVQIGPQTTIIRSFRIGRIFRIIKKAGNLKRIFTTFIVTLPSLANVGGLLFLLLFLYSVLGVFLFSQVKLHGALTEHANFQTFGTALLTLTRVSTGEAWNEIMYACATPASVDFTCVEEVKNGDGPIACGNGVSYFFFISFMLIVSLIFLNLFIAIILEGFFNTTQADQMRISELAVEDFKEVWQDFDYDGTGYISVLDMNEIVRLLAEKECDIIDHRLHRVLKRDRYMRDKYIAELRIPVYNTFTKYSYYDCLEIMSKKLFSNDQKKKSEQKKKEKEFIESQKTEQDEVYNTQEREEMEEELVSDFDMVIEKVHEKMENEKISLTESFKRAQKKKEKSIKKNKYVLDINLSKEEPYDSAHVIYVPKLQELARNFIQKIRQQRIKHTDPFEEMHEANDIAKEEPLETKEAQRRQTQDTEWAPTKEVRTSDGANILVQDNMNSHRGLIGSEELSPLAGADVKHKKNALTSIQSRGSEEAYGVLGSREDTIGTSRNKGFIYSGNDFYKSGVQNSNQEEAVVIQSRLAKRSKITDSQDLKGGDVVTFGTHKVDFVEATPVEQVEHYTSKDAPADNATGEFSRIEIDRTAIISPTSGKPARIIPNSRILSVKQDKKPSKQQKKFGETIAKIFSGNATTAPSASPATSKEGKVTQISVNPQLSPDFAAPMRVETPQLFSTEFKRYVFTKSREAKSQLAKLPEIKDESRDNFSPIASEQESGQDLSMTKKNTHSFNNSTRQKKRRMEKYSDKSLALSDREFMSVDFVESEVPSLRATPLERERQKQKQL